MDTFLGNAILLNIKTLEIQHFKILDHNWKRRASETPKIQLMKSIIEDFPGLKNPEIMEFGGVAPHIIKSTAY